jgi:hypothetical protein
MSPVVRPQKADRLLPAWYAVQVNPFRVSELPRSEIGVLGSEFDVSRAASSDSIDRSRGPLEASDNVKELRAWSHLFSTKNSSNPEISKVSFWPLFPLLEM